MPFYGLKSKSHYGLTIDTRGVPKESEKDAALPKSSMFILRVSLSVQRLSLSQVVRIAFVKLVSLVTYGKTRCLQLQTSLSVVLGGWCQDESFLTLWRQWRWDNKGPSWTGGSQDKLLKSWWCWTKRTLLVILCLGFPACLSGCLMQANTCTLRVMEIQSHALKT